MAIFIRLGGAAAAAVGASYVGRSYYSLFEKDGRKHTDDTFVGIASAARLPRSIKVEYRDENGEMKVTVVDADKYSEEVVRQVLVFEQLRATLREKAKMELGREVEPAFNAMRCRIPRFADWYFSYATTYYFFSRVLMSAAAHTASITRTDSIQDCVNRDIEAMIQSKYSDMVLRPEIADPVLQRAFTEALSHCHTYFVKEAQDAEAQFLRLIQQHAGHALSLPSGTLRLDWVSQSAKATHLQNTFEKSPEQSLGLIVGGSVVGKAAGGAIVGKTAAAGAGKAAATGLVAKMSAPFVSALSGAASGALAGPGGMVLGAGAGITVDMLINKGTALMRRDEFESDVGEAIDSAKDQWAATTHKELSRAIDVWVDESVQALQFSASRS